MNMTKLARGNDLAELIGNLEAGMEAVRGWLPKLPMPSSNIFEAGRDLVTGTPVPQVNTGGSFRRGGALVSALLTTEAFSSIKAKMAYDLQQQLDAARTEFEAL